MAETDAPLPHFDGMDMEKNVAEDRQRPVSIGVQISMTENRLPDLGSDQPLFDFLYTHKPP
jgi:hypothetical protein